VTEDEDFARRVRGQVDEELGRHPGAASWKRAAAVLGSAQLLLLVASAALFGTQNWRASSGNPAALAGASAALLALIAGGALTATMPRGRGLVRAFALLACLAPLSVLLVADVHPLQLLKQASPWKCVWTEVGLSVAPAALAAWALAGSALRPLRSWVASAGAASGGLLLLLLHCPDLSLSHVSSFHLAPWALMTALAVLLRRGLTSRTLAP